MTRLYGRGAAAGAPPPRPAFAVESWPALCAPPCPPPPRVGGVAATVVTGAGVGYSMLDGLIRADVARGLFPAKQWRADLYLEAKF